MLVDFGVDIARIIADIGRSVTVRTYVNSGTAFDPTRTPIDTTATAAIFDFDASEVDGSVIQRNDKEIILASTVTVTKQSVIIDGSITYTIESLEEVGPGDNVLMYIVQGRG